MIKFFSMKILIVLSLLLFSSLSSAQSNIGDNTNCLSIEQSMLMDDTHIQCDNICASYIAVQGVMPNLQQYFLVLMSYTFTNVHYYSLSEPIITPPPIS